MSLTWPRVPLFPGISGRLVPSRGNRALLLLSPVPWARPAQHDDEVSCVSSHPCCYEGNTTSSTDLQVNNLKGFNLFCNVWVVGGWGEGVRGTRQAPSTTGTGYFGPCFTRFRRTGQTRYFFLVLV